jgi:hypothetical protein
MPNNPPVPSLGASPAAAMLPGGVLAPGFAGPSWLRWMAVIKAAFADPMTDEEIALFREIADRDPPKRRVRELWCVIGRGGGKDSVASGIAASLALRDYRKYLRPGEKPTVVCIASDRTQAQIVQGYILGYFHDYDELRPLIAKENADGVELTNGVAITIATNSFKGIRGRTIVAAILDEVALRSRHEPRARTTSKVCRCSPLRGFGWWMTGAWSTSWSV